MDSVSGAAFLLMWATVLSAPPLAFALFLSFRRLWPRVQLPAAVVAIAILFFSYGIAQLGLSFTSALVDVACVAAVYFTYCLVAASCLQIPFIFFRYSALVVSSLPICVGYVLGTVGVLGLGWIVADYTRPPQHTEKMRPDLICEVTSWGSVASRSGYTVHLFKIWAALPFAEREVVRFKIVQAGYIGEPPTDKTCADALNAYAP
jgi:hypothetical protein